MAVDLSNYSFLSGDVGLRENGSGGLTTDFTKTTTKPANPINFGYLPQNYPSTTSSSPAPAPAPSPAPAPAPTGDQADAAKKAQYGGLPGYTEEGNPIVPPSPEEIKAQQLRAEISSAWDAYINEIPNEMNYYNQQGEALTGRAENFKKENLATLQDSKAQSLRDMQRVARGALQAGNNYLGQLGAGDSSARDMYSFAINKQQQQQQGELDRFTMTEERKINSEYQNQIFGIQEWLAQQQQALAVAQREGRLQKGLDLANLSRDLLNNALQAAATARQNAETRKTALLQWAADNSLNAGQLQSNLAAIQQPMGFANTNTPTSGTALVYGGNGGTVDELNQ